MVTPHREEFIIYGFQGDASGVATLAALAEYMEEAAGNHAAELGLSIERLYGEGVAWVLARMQIAPEKMPSINDRISVETWPVAVEGLQYRRDFILRREDGAVAARAVTHWVVVNLETRKAGRVPAFIAEARLANPATAMDDVKTRPPAPEECDEVCRFRARLADIDRNGHVNNVRYMDWVMESVPEAVRGSGRLRRLELAFKAESRQGDVVSARTSALPSEKAGGRAIFAHGLVRTRDGKELVRACTLWDI